MIPLPDTIESRIAIARSSGFNDHHARLIAECEDAIESHDLHAFGHGRKFAAHARVVATWQAVEAEGLTEAFTSSERAQVRSSLSYVS